MISLRIIHAFIHISNLSTKPKLWIMKKTFILLSLASLLCICSCKSGDDIYSEEEELVKTTALENKDLEKFTSVVQNALINSSDFRKLLKEEVNLQRDGDYDMILKKAVDGDVKSTIGLRNSFSIRDLLNESQNKISRLRSSKVESADELAYGSYIDNLLKKYPNLQISIPVNADKWNADSEIPVITYIPFDKKDLDGTPLVGYRANGDTIMLSDKTPPTFPVIVIGLNERGGKYYDEMSLNNENSNMNKIQIVIVQGGVSVPTPSSLSCLPASTGISLSWSCGSGASSSNTQGYIIYRKAAGESTFEPYATTSGLSNTTFIDQNVTTGLLYSYYVCGYFFNTGLNGYSVSNNTSMVSMPGINRPVGLTSLNAEQYVSNSVELRWSTSASEYIPSVDIYKKILVEGGSNEYVSFGSYSPNLSDCNDNSVSPGQRIIYKGNVTTTSGTSNSVYSYIQIPYRNPASPSPVYIKNISFTDKSIEGWTRGHPEFSIKVLGVSNSNQSYEIQGSIRCDFNQKKSFYSQPFYRLAHNWRPGFWYDMLTFYAYEIDSEADVTVKLSAKCNAKSDAQGLLTAEVGAEASCTIPEDRQSMGSQTYGYYDQINYEMVFPNYGFKLTVGQ